MEQEQTLVKIAGTTAPGRAGRYIAELFKEDKHRTVEVRAYGKHATTVAVQAVTRAREFAQEQNLDLVIQPAIVDIQVDGTTQQGMALFVSERILATY